MSSPLSPYNLVDDDPSQIQVHVIQPTEIKSSLSSYTSYKIKGVDKNGQFQCTRRYSQFNLIRQQLVKRWPGCYIPAIPQKKLINNSNTNFVQNRRHGLQTFCQDVASLPHLWYSAQFQIFIRKTSDVENCLKSLPIQTHQDIIKKYDERLVNIKGKGVDTNLIAKVLQFSKHLKKIQPLLHTFKQFLASFCQKATNNDDQYLVLFNYILPQFQKVCFSTYNQQNNQQKLIFSDGKDQKLANFINKLKQITSQFNFNILFLQIQLEQREVSSFLQVFNQHDLYQKKLAQLKQKQKQLQLQQQKLNMGKQGFFESIMKKDINISKKDIERQISQNKDLIQSYSLMTDLMLILLGFFQIDRFKDIKVNRYQKTIQQLARVQVQLAQLQNNLCNHILQNHNLTAC